MFLPSEFLTKKWSSILQGYSWNDGGATLAFIQHLYIPQSKKEPFFTHVRIFHSGLLKICSGWCDVMSRWATFTRANWFKANIFMFSLHIFLKCAVKLALMNHILISMTWTITLQAEITVIIFIIAVIR